MTQIIDYEPKFSEMLACISAVNDMRARSQLYKMYTNCRKIHTEMSQELVECRRRKKLTQKYTELETNLNLSISEFEQWTTFANLLY